jgi:hypothetical protein
MTTITILPEPQTGNGTAYRAVSGKQQSQGRTPGEALDALTAQLGEQGGGTIVVLQQMRPDQFFTAQQQQRLGELMERWRAARDAGRALPAEEQTELDALIAAELEAATRRAAALLRELQP